MMNKHWRSCKRSPRFVPLKGRFRVSRVFRMAALHFSSSAAAAAMLPFALVCIRLLESRRKVADASGTHTHVGCLLRKAADGSRLLRPLNDRPLRDLAVGWNQQELTGIDEKIQSKRESCLRGGDSGQTRRQSGALPWPGEAQRDKTTAPGWQRGVRSDFACNLLSDGKCEQIIV